MIKINLMMLGGYRKELNERNKEEKGRKGKKIEEG